MTVVKAGLAVLGVQQASLIILTETWADRNPRLVAILKTILVIALLCIGVFALIWLIVRRSRAAHPPLPPPGSR